LVFQIAVHNYIIIHQTALEFPNRQKAFSRRGVTQPLKKIWAKQLTKPATSNEYQYTHLILIHALLPNAESISSGEGLFAIPERIPDIAPNNEYVIGLTLSTSRPMLTSISDQSIKPNPDPKITVWPISRYNPIGTLKNRSVKVMFNALNQISITPTNDKNAVPSEILKMNTKVNMNVKVKKGIELLQL
jgi:hypothetical protein